MTSTVPLVSVIGSYKVSRSSMFCLRTLGAVMQRDQVGQSLRVSGQYHGGPLREAMRAVCTAYSDVLDDVLKEHLADKPEEEKFFYWPGMGSHAANRQKVIAEASAWTQPLVTVFPPYPADETVRDALCAVIAFLLARYGREEAADILGIAIIDAMVSLRDEAPKPEPAAEPETVEPQHDHRSKTLEAAASNAPIPDVEVRDDQTFLGYMRRLRRQAGTPSLVTVATGEAAQLCFTGSKEKPEWHDVENIVKFLDGDVSKAHQLWRRYCAELDQT